MKIDQKALEEFRQTLPADIQYEVFNWLFARYSIATALFLIKQKRIALETVVVKEWCEALGLVGPYKPDNNSYCLFNGVCDKEVMQPNINPDIPLIMVEHSYKKGLKMETIPLLIDGNKRLRKAFIEGREKLNAFYLPKNLAIFALTTAKSLI